MLLFDLRNVFYPKLIHVPMSRGENVVLCSYSHLKMKSMNMHLIIIIGNPMIIVNQNQNYCELAAFWILWTGRLSPTSAQAGPSTLQDSLKKLTNDHQHHCQHNYGVYQDDYHHRHCLNSTWNLSPLSYLVDIASLSFRFHTWFCQFLVIFRHFKIFLRYF